MLLVIISTYNRDKYFYNIKCINTNYQLYVRLAISKVTNSARGFNLLTCTHVSAMRFLNRYFKKILLVLKCLLFLYSRLLSIQLLHRKCGQPSVHSALPQVYLAIYTIDIHWFMHIYKGKAVNKTKKLNCFVKTDLTDFVIFKTQKAGISMKSILT